MDDYPSMISHVSVGTTDVPRAMGFYDAVLATLGYARLIAFPRGAGYGLKFPEFYVELPHDTQPAASGNGHHVAFKARSPECVRSFHAAALAGGGRCDGAPGPRPEFGEAYYGCFVRDPDGNKIEAVYLDWARIQA